MHLSDDTATYGPSRDRQSLSRRVLTLLLLCSASLNLLLARDVKNLKASVLYLKAEMRSQRQRELKIGDSLPRIEIKNLDGRSLVLDYPESGPATILYIFAPQCVWCTRNLPNVTSLADRTRSNYLFIGISLSKDTLREYVAQHNLNFPVYTDLTAEAISAYHLGGTPRTLVVSPGGRIVRNWFGAYGGELRREIEGFFKIRLPGIPKPEAKEEGEVEEGCDSCGDTPDSTS